MDSLEGESDRALIVLVFSYIEGLLRDCFARELNTALSQDTLLENFGPLATTSARIKMAFALYWLSPDVYADLERLRRLRNHAAHSPFDADFAAAKVVSIVKSMTPREAPLLNHYAGRIRPGEEWTTRTVFQVRAMLTCQTMLLESLTAPTAVRMGLPPHAVLSRAHDELPENLRNVSLAVADWMLKLGGVLWREAPGSSPEAKGGAD